ncbi:MAG: hypothetical protein E3J72_00920 [Planctomycetota bacterium]|nr:MAG: hypothetical protein E3J72_00920 [Planctomycetota bacterium]
MRTLTASVVLAPGCAGLERALNIKSNSSTSEARESDTAAEREVPPWRPGQRPPQGWNRGWFFARWSPVSGRFCWSSPTSPTFR